MVIKSDVEIDVHSVENCCFGLVLNDLLSFFPDYKITAFRVKYIQFLSTTNFPWSRQSDGTFDSWIVPDRRYARCMGDRNKLNRAFNHLNCFYYRNCLLQKKRYKCWIFENEEPPTYIDLQKEIEQAHFHGLFKRHAIEQETPNFMVMASLSAPKSCSHATVRNIIKVLVKSFTCKSQEHILASLQFV